MSAAQVAKLEALLARVQSRRLEPGLRLVDAAPPSPAPVETLTSLAAAEDDLDLSATARAPIAPTAGAANLLTLDEPVAAKPPTQRVTMEVDPDMDDLLEVDMSEALPPTPQPTLELAEPEDALVTAVARPAPVAHVAPVAPAPAVPAVPAAPVAAAPVAVAPVAAAPVAVAPEPEALFEDDVVPTPPSGLKSTGPIIMHAASPVASGPVASFVGTSQRTHPLSFGELVGLAMSLTTR